MKKEKTKFLLLSRVCSSFSMGKDEGSDGYKLEVREEGRSPNVQ